MCGRDVSRMASYILVLCRSNPVAEYPLELHRYYSIAISPGIYADGARTSKDCEDGGSPRRLEISPLRTKGRCDHLWLEGHVPHGLQSPCPTDVYLRISPRRHSHCFASYAWNLQRRFKLIHGIWSAVSVYFGAAQESKRQFSQRHASCRFEPVG